MVGKPYGLAVKAMVCREDGHCLLLRRSSSSTHFAGQWEWPGGKTDRGEDFITALRREVTEETGLAIDFTGFAGANCYEMERLHVVCLCMEARVAGGALTLSGEHDAAEWVKLADLPRWDLAPNSRSLVLEYFARKTRGV